MNMETTSTGRINSGEYGRTRTAAERAAYNREWRRKNPEAWLRIRLQTAVKLLERNGYKVTQPEQETAHA